jgi:acetyl esterase
MRPSPETRRFIDGVNERMPPFTPDDSTLAGLRAAEAAGVSVITGPDVAEVRDLACPGPAGDIALRLYHPAPGGPPLPGIVFLHGGGWVAGNLDTHDHIARLLADGTGAAVVAVDYRIAPEAPFPAAPDDASAALRWTAANAAGLGVDPALLAVAGDSAGGTLAAVAAREARDADGPDLVYQALIYPATDLTGYPPGPGCPYPSRTENGDGYFLTLDAIAWYTERYVPDPAARRDPRASPLHAPDLAGLPPALVLTADFDPLRDEGEAYARALAEAGVPATTARINGGFHGMFGMGAFVSVGRQAEQVVVTALRSAFATAAPRD